MIVGKLTKNDLKGVSPLVAVGYCGAAHLLQGLEPVGYNSGYYGWNWDLFQFDGVAVCTGYGNLAGAKMDDLVADFNERARSLRRR